jgi:O-acetyl-ADP-ribose deacetylase (regulator of RNase III)
MVEFIKGDMLQAKAEALVNTVNTVGVMGKGIALQFKEAFPYNNKVYIDVCKKKELVPGKLLGVWDENLLLGRKYIINFPTKVHWRQPSKYEYIERTYCFGRFAFEGRDSKCCIASAWMW